jgi:filamentous hemagglutinin
MNQHLYRVIFNKARGLWMAVQETASGFGKTRRAGEANGVRRPHPQPFEMLHMTGLAFAALCVFGMQPVLVQAQVVASPSAAAANKPVVGVTANGLPIVQITTPNAAGVSNNQYSAYNVGAAGVILNNAQNNALTQQAGYVGGNPYLAAGSARIIVNQVVGGSTSQLLGYTEVAGQQAQVVIANPAGIFCNGCGFINTSRGVLTTGTPVYGGSGSLDAFHVTAGQIQIGSAGLNGSNVDQVDLIARSVQINGKLWANQQLNVVTGTNDVNYTDLSTQALTPDANTPSVAIDVAQLGGMYANKIKLVGTEAGVGVNSLGTIAAQAGDLTLNSQGQVSLAGSTTASGNVQINGAGNVGNSGTLYAGQSATVGSQAQVSNSGTLAALGNLAVSGAGVNSSGTLGAGIDAGGQASGTGSLSVSATGAVTATGQNLAGGNVALSGSSLNLTGAQTTAGGTAALTATGAGGDTGNIDHTGGTLSAAGAASVSAAGAVLNNRATVNAAQLTVNAASLSNQGGQLTQTGASDTAVTVSGNLDNTNGVIASNAQNLTVQSGNLTNQGGQINHAGTGTLKLNTAALSNDGGTIASNGQGTLNASSVSNTGGSISTAGALGVTGSGDITNSQGTISAGGAATLSGANIGNTGGRIVSLNGDGLSLTASGQIVNTAGTTAQGTAGGVIGGNGNTTLQAAALANAGSITAAQGLSATVTNLLDNSGGKLSATGALNANAASFKNNLGTLSGATLALTAPQLDNSGGQITTNQLTLTSTNLTNHGGTLTQLGTGVATVGVSNTLDNSSGGLIQTNSQDLSLTPATLNNNGGTIAHAGTGTLTLTPGGGAGTLSNVGGTLATNGQVVVTAGSLDNTGGTVSGQTGLSAVVGGALTNTNGTLRSAANLSATSTGALANNGGKINAGGTASANNTSTLNLSAASLDNTGGAIVNVGTGATTVSGTHQIANSNASGTAGQGLITGNGNVSLTTAALSNTQNGQLSGASLQINAATLDNSGGQIGNIVNATGNVGITTTGTVTNTSGQIGAAQNLTIAASTLLGSGAFTAAGDVTLNLQGDFSNAAGNQISASHNLLFSLPGSLTNSGAFFAGNNLSINSGNAINNYGSMAAGALLSTHSATVVNTGTLVGASVSLAASQSISNLGTTALIGATDSAGKLELLAPDIENRDDSTATDTPAQTAIYGLGQVVLAGGKDSNGNYTAASQVRNQSALIQSGGDMLVNANLLTNTRRTLVTSSTYDTYVDPSVLANLGVSLSGVTGQENYHDPNSIGGVYIEPPHGGRMNSDYLNTTYYGTALANSVQSISPQAQIVSGGNLTTSVGTLQNYWSQVSAVGNIALSGTLDQNSWQGQMPLQVQVVYSGTYNYRTYKGDLWTMSFCASGCDAPADIRTYALPSYESSFTAGGTLSGNNVTINNTSGNALIAPLGLAAGQALPGVNPASINGTLPGGGVTSPANTILSRATALTVLNNITLPQGGLFKTNTAPGAQYLIVTNPAFANLQQWLSSDYYFQQMGVNPSQIQERLGDGFYEQQLVQNQIMSLTGKAVLTNYASTQAEFQALMTSGAALAQSLNLVPGMALSAAQVAQLTSNVVIMQTQVVGGQSVLVPVVYLAQASQQNMGNGPLIAANNINLTNTQGFNNSGTVSATNGLAVSGQSINNQGGALQSGGLMALNTTGDVNLTSASVQAGSLQLAAGGNLILNTGTNTVNQVGSNGATRSTTTLAPLASLAVTGDAQIATGGDFTQNAGALSVGGNLVANIGGSWLMGTQQTGESKVVARLGGVSDTSFNQAVGSSLQVGGAAAIQVGNDFVATGAQIGLAGGGSLQAGGDVELLAAKATSTVNSTSSGSSGNSWAGIAAAMQPAFLDQTGGTSLGTRGGRSYSESLQTSDDTVTGTTLQSGQSLSITSGKDITLSGSTLSLTQGAATLVAAGNVNIGVATEQHTSNFEETHTGSGLANTKTTFNQLDQSSTLADGSTISADSISIKSGKDIAITGSNVVATNDVALNAANNVTITAATSTSQVNAYSHSVDNGLLADGGLAVTNGTRDLSLRTNQTAATQSQNRSLVGSTAGSLTINSGKDTAITGSDVIAGNNINITGQNVTVNPGVDQVQSSQIQTYKQSGTTVTLTGTGALGALQQTVTLAQHASQSTDSRAQALYGVAAARAGYDTYQSAQAVSASNAAGSQSAVGLQISISEGTSHSGNNSADNSSTVSGSTLSAGNALNITATGNVDAAGNPVKGTGDITISGSQLTGKDVTLQAANNVNVLAAQSTDHSNSTNSSSSDSVGVAFNIGGQGFGFSLTAAAAMAHGDSDGQSVTNVNSTVTGSNSVTLKSGADTNLIGAQVTGGTINANVGGNLNVVSLQDTQTYSQSQNSAGFAVSIPIYGYGQAGFSASAETQNGNSSYASVGQQSGLFAGSGGYAVQVANNTNLVGSVISSTADASKNSLSTGTLTTSDLQNHADYSATSMGITAGMSGGMSPLGGGTSQPVGKPLNNVIPDIPQFESGSQSSTSYAAISPGTVNITNNAAQLQLTGKDAATTVAGLDHDTANANQTLSQNPNVAAILNTQQQRVGAMEAAGAAIAKTEGDIATQQENNAIARLTKANGALEADPSNTTLQAAVAQAQSDVTNWADGGAYRAALQAAGAALLVAGGGGGAGEILGAAAGTAASNLASPYTKQLGQSIAQGLGVTNSNLAAAIANLTTSVASGVIGGVVGGGAGASTAATFDAFNRQLHPDDIAAIHAKANGDAAEEKKLTQAACYAVQCWAEFSPNSVQYLQNYLTPQDVQSLGLGPELAWVNSQKVSGGLFDYTPLQILTDGAKSQLDQATRGAKQLGQDVLNLPHDIANSHVATPGDVQQGNADPQIDLTGGNGPTPSAPAVVTSSIPIVAETPVGPVVVGTTPIVVSSGAPILSTGNGGSSDSGDSSASSSSASSSGGSEASGTAGNGTNTASELTFGDNGRKLDFLFNQNIDSSNAYNAARAAGNASRIGIADTPANRAEVTQLFNQAYNDPSSIVGPGTVPGSNLREFYLPGSTGTGSKIQFVELNGKVLTIIAK